MRRGRLLTVMCSGSAFLIVLVLMANLLVTRADPPIDEIRLILAQRTLKPPSSESLAKLRRDHVDEGLRTIDPYARYEPPMRLGDKTSDSASLGIEVFQYKSKIWVRPDQGGPAGRSGMPEISQLVAINRKRLPVDLAAVSNQLDAAIRSGTAVLTIAGLQDGREKDYQVKMSKFKVPSVTWRVVADDLMLRINAFVSHDTGPGLYAILSTQVRPGTRVVLDLRGCSGGDLYEALEIAGLFVPAGCPLAVTYNRAGTLRTYQSQADRKLSVPLWVLIDYRTASAAEILAGVLQYHHLAVIVGERSFGKCVSQTLLPLSDGGGLWLTNLGVRFPDGSSCNETGIKPDVTYPDVSIGRLSDICSRIFNNP
jgi:carboxyl-terminal processing protease